MELFIEVRKDTYCDSVLTLLTTAVLQEKEGVEKANVAMGTEANKQIFKMLNMSDPRIDAAGDGDLVIAMLAESEEAFRNALPALDEVISPQKAGDESASYATLGQALQATPDANVCIISIPGEYARAEAERALNAGLHVMLFSNAVPPEDEKAIKELAHEKGLLCMGPDCGVVNLNDVAFLLASINNRGPFGICGASGCGIQHVAALLHANGSGISQGIGTGGGDLKAPVYGATMLDGIDALEDDPDTKYIILVSRKPNEVSMKRVLERVSRCKKPVVVYFMGCEREEVEWSGAIWAESLDDTAAQALKLIGKDLQLISEEELDRMAAEAVVGMLPEQKYVRGMFDGGTYCDEAIGTMEKLIGPIHSNVAAEEELRLKDSLVSVGNSCVDYGEEEFTQGRPHPTMMPEVRNPAIMREASDPETAVLLFDFIFSPAAPRDPVGAHIPDIRKAMELAESRGGKLAVVASICGTDADIQGLEAQKQKLLDVGAYVCPTNYTAAKLAAKIVNLRNGGTKA